MATTTRSQKIQKTLKVLGSVYQPVSPVDRPVIEHLLYACCLENSSPEAADETFARLQELYFDWNEVRVTSIRELEEVMARLTDPTESATRLTQCLQSVFEKQYSFDLEPLRKMNQGKAVAELEKIKGATPFAVQYVVQHALGGHAIPVSQGVLDVFRILDIISDAEAESGRVPGLERAIPKNKGPQMASLIHQLGADFHRSPFSPKVRDTILKIDPQAKDRLPKRTRKKAAASAESTTETEVTGETESKKETASKSSKKSGTKKTVAKKTAASEPKEATAKTSPKAQAKAPAKKKPTKKTAAPKKSAAAKKETSKSSAAKSKKSAAKSKPVAKTAAKSTSKTLARKKPR